MKLPRAVAASLELALLLPAFAAAAIDSSAPARSVESEVTFTRTHDPGRVALFVQSTRPSAGVRESITIYGDGRTVLSRKAPGDEISSAEGELQLDATRIDLLFDSVVRGGLADFDPTTVRAQELRRGDGFRPRSSSGPIVKILVSLDTLERDGRLSSGIHKKIEIMSPELAAEYYPEIREYQAVLVLLEFMERVWREWTVSNQ
jgi:hypothetical protein